MAEAADDSKKIINPRVEIDTSPPFESVKEAVDRFGGSGPWIPHHLLRLAAGHHESEVFDVEKMEEQAVQLERDLIMKEQETLNVLKELEAAKRFVEDLKANLMPEFSSSMPSPYLKLDNSRLYPDDSSPGLMFMELNQAKLKLNKTSIDLAVIQASIASLNKKMRKEKAFIEKTNTQVPNPERVMYLEENHHQKVEVANRFDISMNISKEMKEVNYEAEQFKKITEASRYEVMKAMTEIELTKNSIKMAEMRLNAAKKMEEAAKAVEAIALAETKALLNHETSSDGFMHKPDGITLSFEEYKALTQKAQQAEELCKTKFIDTNGVKRTNKAHHHLEVPVMEKFEQATNENKSVVGEPDFFSKTENKFKFRNSHPGHRNPRVLNGGATKEKPSTGFWSKTSIGDMLSRELILQDDVVVGRHRENHSEREHISLSQMLREQRRVMLHPSVQPTGDGNVDKRFFVQRKKFGFIQVPIPTKQSKKKAQQPVNLR